MSKYKGLVISDIHVGAFDIHKLYDEFINVFIGYINNLKKLDFLIIDGDYFDRKFYLNDKESIMAYKMMQDLIDTIKPFNTKLRIVYGTESHECNQYNVLSMMDLYDNMRIIKHVEEEDLFDDLKILYLPEEYLEDSDDYYKEFFNTPNKYDYVFGHGVIREVMKDAVAHMSTSKQKRMKAPIFKSNELEFITKGEVYFGHYHLNYELNDKIFSVSSFSRWKFGEEGRKGFYELNVNTDKEKYNHKFIENTMADIYKTIGFGYSSDVFKDNEVMDRELSRIDKLVQDNIFQHVRFEFNIPKDIENPESTIDYIKERYKFSKDIKVEMTHGYIDEKREKQKEQIKLSNEKDSYIYDNNIKIPEKVSLFIKFENDKDLPSSIVDDYLTKTVEEIMEETSDG